MKSKIVCLGTKLELLQEFEIVDILKMYPPLKKSKNIEISAIRYLTQKDSRYRYVIKRDYVGHLLQNFLEQKRFLDLIDEGEKYLSEDPDCTDILRLCGIAYIGTQNFLHAIDTFEKILALDPNDSMTLMNHAMACLQNEQEERALKFIKTYGQRLVADEIHTLAGLLKAAVMKKSIDEASVPAAFIKYF